MVHTVFKNVKMSGTTLLIPTSKETSCITSKYYFQIICQRSFLSNLGNLPQTALFPTLEIVLVS